MSADLVAAVVDRLDALGLNGGAHDATPNTKALPAVAVYADGGIRSSDREADVRIRKTIGFQTTVLGSSAGNCRAALDLVTAALEDWRPTVAGWTCSKVEHSSSQPVRPDPELPDRVVFIATDQWSFVADPA